MKMAKKYIEMILFACWRKNVEHFCFENYWKNERVCNCGVILKNSSFSPLLLVSHKYVKRIIDYLDYLRLMICQQLLLMLLLT